MSVQGGLSTAVLRPGVHIPLPARGSGGPSSRFYLEQPIFHLRLRVSTYSALGGGVELRHRKTLTVCHCLGVPFPQRAGVSPTNDAAMANGALASLSKQVPHLK